MTLDTRRLALPKKVRERLVREILKTTSGPHRKDYAEELSKGSDTLIILEYKERVDPEASISLYDYK